MSASIRSSIAIRSSSSVSLSQPSSWTTMPALKPRRSAGPAAGPSVWVDPPPGVELKFRLHVSGYFFRYVFGASPSCARRTKWGVVHRSSRRGATRVQKTHAGEPPAGPLRPTTDGWILCLPRAWDDERVTEDVNPPSGTDNKRSGAIATVIHEGLPTQLPDIDPEETSDWIESFDALVDERGRERARYVMLRLLERAREMQVGVPALRSTDYINTIPPEREPWFPGDEETERRIRAFIRWNAAVMVSSANRKGLEVGGHIATYQSSASLYEVGFNHFFRGKDHPGGGDQIYIQGHASPGIYARAFLEGRLT